MLKARNVFAGSNARRRGPNNAAVVEGDGRLSMIIFNAIEK